MTCKVFLVGAGPGDPDLITHKGLQCIASADVIIYDYLASPALLKHASDKSETIYVGKKGGDHTLSQEGINKLIVAKAKEGKMVTRLKGGDPFIFGRGGEEAEILKQAGIPFEIVPGVTSAIAAPAYAGIPLTHRNFTSTVAIITGHEDPTKPTSSIDWKALAKGIGTLVFLMGVKNLPSIVKHLTQNGRSVDTPVALIRWGTTTKQQTVTGTLKSIVAQVQKAQLKAPAIIVVGEVVRLRDTLRWFEDQPLLGRRVVVTRARAQASDLIQRLSALGAECLEYPTIKIEPPDDLTPLDHAIAKLSEFDWLVFTSVNGVESFFKRLFTKNLDVRVLGHLKTAVIGPATAAKLQSYGLHSDIMPDTFRAESIIEAFKDQSLQDTNILLPRAAEARAVLPVELRKMGAKVLEIAVYQTQPVVGHAEQLIKHLEAGQVNMVTFTSSSTVNNFKALIPSDRFNSLMDGVAIASIGPITSETAEKLGFNVSIQAQDYTIDGLCKAILQHVAPAADE